MLQSPIVANARDVSAFLEHYSMGHNKGLAGVLGRLAGCGAS